MAFDPHLYAQTTTGTRARLVNVLGLPLPGGQTCLFQIGNEQLIRPYFADGTVNGPGGQASTNDLINAPRTVQVKAWMLLPSRGLFGDLASAQSAMLGQPGQRDARIVELTGTDSQVAP